MAPRAAGGSRLGLKREHGAYRFFRSRGTARGSQRQAACVRCLCRRAAAASSGRAQAAAAALAPLAVAPFWQLAAAPGSGMQRGGCSALMIHVISKGRALPLAWRVRQCHIGHFPQALHIELVALISDGVYVVVGW